MELTDPPDGAPSPGAETVSGSVRSRSPGRVQTRIWMLNAVLALMAGGAGLVATALGRSGDLTRETPLWVLALLFAAFEVLVVHVRFRNDAHTFSMAEAAIALGLLTSDPAHLLIAQTVGSGLVLALHRRQPPVKLAFNLAQQFLGTALAVWVAHLVLQGGDALGPRGWLAVGLAAITSSVVGTSAILAVLRLATGAVSVSSHLGAAGFGLVSSLLSASLGLVGVVVLAARPSATILLAIPAASVYATNMAFVAQRDKHQRLEFLYRATQVLAASQQVETGLAKLLDETRTTLRCDVAALLYRPVDVGDRVLVTSSEAGRPDRLMQPADQAELGTAWWDLLHSERGNGAGPPEFLGHVCAERIVVPIVGETRRVGFLVVARTGRSVTPLGRNDQRVVEALASHLSVTIENGRLEQSLAQLRKLEEVLSYRASHDSLTDLANRSLFTELVATDFALDPQQVGVMFIDLDDFKGVNDTLGHAAGDALLRETALRLRNAVGDRGVPARLGGDEFAVLLRGDASPTGSRRLADEILQSFGPHVTIDGHDVRIKATIGIALGQSAPDADTVLRNADIAMYAAKGAGKGCHRLFHPQMHDVALHRQALLHGLDGAHDRGEIVTYFQPIVDMATGVPKGAEALVRWIHPVHGMLTPDTFVELAEETGRIGPITRHVLELACVEATSWDARLDAPTGAYVSVNLSARDFHDRRLADRVDQTLSDTGLAPDRLLLEVTEGAINDEGEAVRALARLRDLGVRIAIDDFGTGHSSLARLRSLPFDVVKIAQPLVSHANRSPRDRDFAQLMVDLARVLDVDAIAEGVESAAQAAVLREIGFVAAQGYFYSPAVPAADLWSSWRLGAGSRRPSARDRRAPGGRRAADISLVPERRPAGTDG